MLVRHLPTTATFDFKKVRFHARLRHPHQHVEAWSPQSTVRPLLPAEVERLHAQAPFGFDTYKCTRHVALQSEELERFHEFLRTAERTREPFSAGDGGLEWEPAEIAPKKIVDDDWLVARDVIFYREHMG